MRLVAAVLSTVTAGCLLGPAAADGAASRPWVTSSGVRFVTREGTTVVLRGVNISAHSRYMRGVVGLGANFVRLRVLWADVEPRRSVFDGRELRRLDTFVDYYAGHGILIELDLRGKPAPVWLGSTRDFFGHNRRASQAAYLGFARTIVRRYDRTRAVIGYGIFNEPEPYHWRGVGSPRLDRRLLRWQAGIRDAILAIDPYRLVFLTVRGGNYGLDICFRCVGFDPAHTVIDWHDLYNGCCGAGLDATDDNWLPSWRSTHNQRSIDYQGSIRNQWLNLAIPWKRTHRLGIPMIVGEWGVRNDDTNATVYDQQMKRLFHRHGISWARWDMDQDPRLGLISRGALNAQGRWLHQHMFGHG